MDRCDVLVVGGGPAGSSTAWSLVRHGLDVVVVDRAQFPRDKICAGWITPPVAKCLQLDLADYRKDRVLQPIEGFAVSLRGGAASACHRGGVVSYGIRRCEFDDYLLRRSGARQRLGEPLRDLRREAGRWILDGELSAPWLVGAGGHFCPVARHLGVRPGEGEPTTVVAREVEFALGPEQRARCSARPELPALYFERDLRGYGWVVRKGDWLNVGLGRQDAARFPERVERFLDWLDAEGHVPPGTPRRLKGHAYLLYGEAARPLVGDDALLVGDAAGLAYGRSGEGIRPAVESGLLAARVLSDALHGSHREVRAESEYVRRMGRRFGPRRGRKRITWRERIPFPLRRRAAARLLASPRFAGPVVVDRWFLHREVPALSV